MIRGDAPIFMLRNNRMSLNMNASINKDMIDQLAGDRNCIEGVEAGDGHVTAV